jgi:hypothetical protein
MSRRREGVKWKPAVGAAMEYFCLEAFIKLELCVYFYLVCLYLALEAVVGEFFREDELCRGSCCLFSYEFHWLYFCFVEDKDIAWLEMVDDVLEYPVLYVFFLDYHQS